MSSRALTVSAFAVTKSLLLALLLKWDDARRADKVWQSLNLQTSKPLRYVVNSALAAASFLVRQNTEQL